MTDAFDVYAEGTYHDVLNTGLVGRQMATVHRLMERPYRGRHFDRVLEVGAGIGEHLPFVSSTWNDYTLTDIRIDRLRAAVQEEASLHVQQADVTNLPFPDQYFNRVISTCLIAHVSDPVQAFAELHRVARPGAAVTIYLPCEPGLLLRVARALTTIPKNRRLGVPDPYFHHFREHVHYFSALNHYLRREFAHCTIRASYWPLPLLSWNMNLFKIYQISVS